MVTGIAFIQMQVRDLDACRDLYGPQLGFKELAYGSDRSGAPVSIFAVGTSVLQLHESGDAVTEYLPSGQRMEYLEAPGAIQHFSFYTQDNQRVFDELHEVLQRNRQVPLGAGPSLQPLDHAYTQRTLLSFLDPSGYSMQISELVDPRDHLKPRLAFKKAVARAGGPGLLQGFDHIHIVTRDVQAERAFFGQVLGLQELLFRTQTVPPVAGFAESVMAAGMTELEFVQSDESAQRRLGPGVVCGLGFATDDLDTTYRRLQDCGQVDIDHPVQDVSPLPAIERRGFSLRRLGGLELQIVQASNVAA